MKQKELKRLLIEKANHVEIKDFSYDIIEKMKHKTPIDTMIMTQPKAYFRMKPVLTFSLAILLIVMITWVIYPYFNEDTPTRSIIMDVKDDIVLSSIQATSMIEIVETELSVFDQTLRFGPPERDSKIRDEFKDIAKYLQTIEKLYGSNQSYDITDDIKDKPGNQRLMRFKTRDLVDHEDIYEFEYGQSVDPEKETYDIIGTIKKNERSFPVIISGHTTKKGFIMTVKRDELNYVVMTFDEDTLKNYTIELFVLGVSIQKVTMTLAEIDREKVATLTFVEGSSSGNYTFRVIEEDRKKVISIDYALRFDDELETGNITIRMLTLPNRILYGILVKPDGRIPFTFTQDRASTQQSNTNL